MLKATKIILVTSLTLVIAGVATMGVAFAASGFDKDIFHFKRDYEKKNYDLDDEFTSIKIDTVDNDIKFVKSEDDGTHVECWDCDELEYTVKVENGVLNIDQKDNRAWYDFVRINFDFSSDDHDLVIALPEEAYDLIDIDTTSADIDIPDFLTIGTLEIDVTSGDVESRATVTESISLDTTSGDIDISNADCATINLEATSGDIKLSDSMCDSFEIDTTSGDVDIINCTIDGIAEIDVTSGDITITNSTAGSFDTDVTSGDVSFN